MFSMRSWAAASRRVVVGDKHEVVHTEHDVLRGFRGVSLDRPPRGGRHRVAGEAAEHASQGVAVVGTSQAGLEHSDSRCDRTGVEAQVDVDDATDVVLARVRGGDEPAERVPDDDWFRDAGRIDDSCDILGHRSI